jgi:hypothetical protein
VDVSRVDSHNEALILANAAVAYINANGAHDDAFVAYFGTTDDATKQLGVYSVCPGDLDSTTFLIPSDSGHRG